MSTEDTHHHHHHHHHHRPPHHESLSDVTSSTINRVDAAISALKMLEPHVDTLPMGEFETVVRAMLTMFDALGHAFMVARRDVLSKLDAIEQRMSEAGAAPAGRSSIVALVHNEIERKKHLTGKKGQSATRSLLRILWFFDFVDAVITHFAHNPEWSVRECASHAYRETLAQHHGFLIRTTFQAAIAACPSRATLIHRLAADGGDDATVLDKTETFIAHLGPLRQKIWAVFTERGIKHVP